MMVSLANYDMALLERVVLQLLAETSVKGLVILLSAAMVTRLWRGMSAARRHLIWAVALGSLVIIPVLSLGLPHWQIPIRDPLMEAVSVQPWSVMGGVSSKNVTVESGGLQTDAMPISVPDMRWDQLLILWFGGALILLLLLAHAVASAAWRTFCARRLTSGPCVEVLAMLTRRLGIKRMPVLVEAGEDAVPITSGLLRPAVVIPRGATHWPRGRLESVLLHELAHIRRRDVLVTVISQIACALYWFNPLVWIALRRLRLESEQACDNVVLAAGVRPSTYAGDLLDFARSIRGHRGLVMASNSMAEPSQLPRRIYALLEEERDRRGISQRSVVASLVIGASLCAAVAGATSSKVDQGSTTASDRVVSFQDVPFTPTHSISLASAPRHNPGAGQQLYAQEDAKDLVTTVNIDHSGSLRRKELKEGVIASYSPESRDKEAPSRWSDARQELSEKETVSFAGQGAYSWSPILAVAKQQESCSAMLKKAWKDAAAVDRALREANTNPAAPKPITIIDGVLATAEDLRELRSGGPAAFDQKVERVMILKRATAEHLTGVKLPSNVVCIVKKT